MNIREHQDHFWAEFENGVSVEVRLEGRVFGGMRRVKCGRRVLRSPDLPIVPLIVGTNGYEVRRLELEDMKQTDGELVMSFRPYVEFHGRPEWGGQPGMERWNVGPWKQEPFRDRGGRLWLTLRELSRFIGDMEFRGFSYGYKYRSRKYRISRIHDRATWELRGRATGNCFYMPGRCGEPRWTMRSKGDAFTTARSAQDEPAGQFLPFFTELPGFTYQFDRQCILVTAFERPLSCLSLFQKNAGANYIIYWHQLCCGAGGAGSAEFPALEVLCAESETASEAERLSQYDAVRTAVWELYCDAADVRLDQAVSVGRLVCGPSTRPSDLKRGIDALADAGCAEVLLSEPVEQQVRISSSKSSEKAAGDVREKVRERIGRIVGLAHQRDLQVGTLLSVPMLAGDPSKDGDAASPGLDYQRVARRLKEEFPVDAFYLDGSVIAGLPAALECRPPHGSVGDVQAQFELKRALQELGLRCGTDGAGAFGVSIAPIPYTLLRGNELLYRDTVMPFPYEEVLAANDDPHSAYFRGYASRLCYGVSFDVSDETRSGLEPWWDDEYTAVNRAYGAVREHMLEARLLPDEEGMLWRRPETGVEVLWPFVEFEWRVGHDARIYDVMAQHVIALEEDTFIPGARRVYLVQDALPA